MPFLTKKAIAICALSSAGVGTVSVATPLAVIYSQDQEVPKGETESQSTNNLPQNEQHTPTSPKVAEPQSPKVDPAQTEDSGPTRTKETQKAQPTAAQEIEALKRDKSTWTPEERVRFQNLDPSKLDLYSSLGIPHPTRRTQPSRSCWRLATDLFSRCR
ncbi:hypothetical protein MHLP_04250 [Candidatus Mycoplasma haematolamae str. Purdue]|uniref:Uncharacterized protein n=1 Tax=Mycoplasma haematolamae (strain Purdue) TaxID=1212765 RepID=I7BAV5_MYCHA|nr:hypothetical protein [Candidatus Mycoplasma haematolamae]AFO52430.1 hypothetical protein MHLP_04250 [Candidatus Mycoplasma haematolamae str. Purdue]